MKSIDRLGGQPVGLPLVADDIVEFHAARILLLLKLCGISGQIAGLTKMAKLDFFARYPSFFDAARASLEAKKGRASDEGDSDAVESAMVRHHYGPWDKRYYHVLSYLEARRLIDVTTEGNMYRIALTDSGKQRAKALVDRPSFAPLAERMREIKMVFGKKSGNTLKKLIYRLFDEEVGKRKMGEVIDQ